MGSSTQKDCSNLFRIASQTPFIIVTRSLSETSDDSMAMHLLARQLNTVGELAYLYIYSPEREQIRCLPSYANLLAAGDAPSNIFAPVITQDIFDFYKKINMSPIFIYPGVTENIFKANFFARYFMSEPDSNLHESNIRSNYNIYKTNSLSKKIISSYKLDDKYSCNLFLPQQSFDYWKASPNQPSRQGICFYQNKNYPQVNYERFLTNTCIEIKDNNFLSHDFLKNLFCKSQYFICNSATEIKLIHTSLMCECPVIISGDPKSDDYNFLIEEFDKNGISLLGDEKGLEHAKLTVKNARIKLKEASDEAPETLKKLALELKTLANNSKPNMITDTQYNLRHILIDRKNSLKLAPDPDQRLEIKNNNGELPYVTLPDSVIKDIARQVMYESQLWSATYKINRFLIQLKYNFYKILGR